MSQQSRTIRRTLALSLALLCATPGLAATGPLLSLQQLAAVPKQTIQDLLPAASAEPAPSGVLQFARTAQVDFDTRRDGQWRREDDRDIWRLQIGSDDAVNLALTLDELALPADAQLRLYDGAGLLWHGPYAVTELTRHAQFWSPVVPGEQLLLELSVPAGSDAYLHIAQVHHGDQPINYRGKSGDCNVDVACPAADSWTDAVRATARITIGGRRLCSAVLLNNTRENGDPLLLTARHCGVEQDADFPASSVVVYWNFESSSCGGNANGSLRDNQSGSVLLADGPDADFTLLRLDRTPPAHFQVYYAGWDATGRAPGSGASVHHPSGDEKRISLFSTAARARTANVDGEPVQSWLVNWSQGVTEAGSSGAGLWSDDHQIIGQLSGGNSSCSNPDGVDVFGRLDVAWQESPEIDGQLRPWLDPAGTGATRLGGLDSNSTGVSARSDNITNLAVDADQWRLDVLANDGGPQLQLIEALASNGQVQIDGDHLVYQFADGQTSDTLSYTVIDRWGQSQTVPVTVERASARANPLTRGGALGPWLLLIILLGSRRWHRR